MTSDAQNNTQTHAAATGTTVLEAAVRRYIRYIKLERGYSRNTVEAYTHDIAYLTAFLADAGTTLEDVRLSHLETFATTLHDKGIGPSSQARILCAVRSFFRFLVLVRTLRDDPSELLESPVLGERIPEVLSTAEVDRMEDSIDLDKWEGPRNRAIIEVLFACGLRVSELVALRLSDLFPAEGYIRVTGKGAKERLVPISESAVDELRSWFYTRDRMAIRPGEEDYVFLNRRGRHLTRTMILIIVKRAAADAGITRTVSPHTLRHSFATALLQGGADLRAIQQMLGHEHIDTTQIYTHIDTTTLRREILEHHPRNLLYDAKNTDSDTLLPSSNAECE